MDGETVVLKTHLCQLSEYNKAKIKQILASNSLVEAGEGRTPRPEEGCQNPLQA